MNTELPKYIRDQIVNDAAIKMCTMLRDLMVRGTAAEKAVELVIPHSEKVYALEQENLRLIKAMKAVHHEMIHGTITIAKRRLEKAISATEGKQEGGGHE